MQARNSKACRAIRPALLIGLVAVATMLLPQLARADAQEQPKDAAAQQISAAHRALIEAIERNVRRTSEYLGKSSLDPLVMAAMAQVPRHEFVPQDLWWRAYEDRALPIGHGQTISQPYIVAVMTDLLGLQPGCRVLDIGTGSGYQAAVLAEICEQVYTIEIVAPLGTAAKNRLERLGYENIFVRIGDGFYGWPEAAPFDAIIVAAVADDLPPPLVAQLKPGGKMIIPVHVGVVSQELLLVEKHTDRQISKREILPVLFVPLTGDHDQKDR